MQTRNDDDLDLCSFFLWTLSLSEFSCGCVMLSSLIYYRFGSKLTNLLPIIGLFFWVRIKISASSFRFQMRLNVTVKCRI